ncbi:MAG TPA: helix-hairpin-helix domain-containing protein [Candidatus Dormibacteraeota bacterium]
MPIHLPPGWPRLAALALPPALAAALLGSIWLFGAGSESPPAPVPAALTQLAPPPAPGLLVFVSGAVAHPGLYRLLRGERAYDAIAAAGGLLADADLARLPNLAARLRDGQQIKVPFGKGPAGSVSAPKIHLNAATLAELETVPGFTMELAQAAISYRDSYGGFASTRELVTVLGMDEADYLVAKKYVTV